LKVAIFPNYDKEGTAEIFASVVELLKSVGAQCYTLSDNSSGCITLAEDELYETSDAIITIGGDGTLIKYAKKASRYGKPCLGINTGRLGFLTNLEKDQIDLLKNLACGRFSVENRMMLSVKMISEGKTVYEGIALNDAVISSGSVAKITDICLNVSGDEIGYRADGIIFSTPTGSTAYSMSAGGPIIDPKVRCITVTPICSHSLTARPMLAHESAEMYVTLKETSRTTAYLTVDGKRCGEVNAGTTIVLSVSPFDAKLINVSANTIYKTVSKKF
jgi:NAD+ kinase